MAIKLITVKGKKIEREKAVVTNSAGQYSDFGENDPKPTLSLQEVLEFMNEQGIPTEFAYVSRGRKSDDDDSDDAVKGVVNFIVKGFNDLKYQEAMPVEPISVKTARNLARVFSFAELSSKLVLLGFSQEDSDAATEKIVKERKNRA